MTQRTIDTAALCPSLATFKSHIRITSNDMDSDLTLKLYAAIRSAEHFIGSVIALSSFKLTDSFASCVSFPEVPFNGVTSVKVDNVAITDYTVEGNVLKFGETVTGNAMEIVYSAGVNNVEYDIQSAILLHAAALFNNPVDSVESLPKASTNLLRPYKRYL